MKTQKLIRLTASEVNSFVNLASGCDFDIDIANQGYERRTIDAKSYLGIMSLDLNKPLIITCHGENDDMSVFLSSHAAG